MNAVTERIVATAMEMDLSISSEQRRLAMDILKRGMVALGPGRSALTMDLPKAMTPRTPSNPYLRRHEAAKYLGCSVRHVDEMKHKGALPFHRLGRRLIVFNTQDLDKLMVLHRVDAARNGE